MSFLAVWKDSYGFPRAWAKAHTRKAAIKEAHRQLDKYVDERRAVGDPLASGRFKLTVQPVKGEVAEGRAK